MTQRVMEIKNYIEMTSPPIEKVPCKVCQLPSSFQYVKGSFCSQHWLAEQGTVFVSTQKNTSLEKG